MKPEDVIKKIEDNKEEIKSYGVEKISLFGSHANGHAEKDSDLDFLVEFKKGRGLFDDYTGLKNYLENLFNKEIDLVKKRLVREELKPSILGGRQVEAEI